MNKVLIVSYHYPPDAAVGSLRVEKMTNFFNHHGLEPIVLTVLEKSYERIDPNKRNEFYDVIVHRTPCWRPPLVSLNNFRKKVSRWFCNIGLFGQSSTVRNKEAVEVEAIDDHIGFLRKIDFTLNNLPDEKIYWIFHALLKGFILGKKNDFKCIVSSAPPHSVSIIAYVLSRLIGCNLVLDYRDPWTVDYVPSTFSCRPNWVNRFEHKLEKYILRKASLVVVNTNEYRERLAKESFIDQNKLLAVYNGFDHNLLEVKEREESNKIILSHFGTLYLERNPENFFLALDQLLGAAPWLRGSLEINFYGQSFFDLEQILSGCCCRDIINICPPIPYQDAVSKMASSDILLAFAQNQPYQIPAKLFDYIGTKKTVLLCGTEGAAFNLIRKLGAGICVSLEKVEQIVAVLEELIVAKRFKVYENYDNASFRREVQFARLVDEIQCMK